MIMVERIITINRRGHREDIQRIIIAQDVKLFLFPPLKKRGGRWDLEAEKNPPFPLFQRGTFQNEKKKWGKWTKWRIELK